MTEGSPHKENQEEFDRPKQIKQLLFAIHKDPATDLISMSSYLKTLSAIDYNGGKRIFK